MFHFVLGVKMKETPRDEHKRLLAVEGKGVLCTPPSHGLRPDVLG